MPIKVQQNASQCIINKAPPPHFKVQYANAELEQPLATYTPRFKIGDYPFEETFIFINQTSFPILGLAFPRKNTAMLDTAQGTIDFPKIQITMALTDAMQKCNLKPITIKTSTRYPHILTVSSTQKIPVSNEHPITGTIHFPCTISAETKLADLQILKPEETKLIRPVDIAALNQLTEHDDVVTSR